MAETPNGFTWQERGDEVRIQHRGRHATTLRGSAARRFLADVADIADAEDGAAQELMARVTGNYRRGNERVARAHPRNRGR